MEGVQTRAQALAMAKRKMVARGEDQLGLATSAAVQLKRRRRVREEDSVETATSADNLDHVLESSCCSSNGSPSESQPERVRDVDLDYKIQSVEQVEAIASNFDDEYRRAKANSSGMPPLPEHNSPPPEQDSPPMCPPAKEIDEFFAAYEKRQKKHFSEKYNFDFVNEVPLEGRYEWVEIKP